MACNYGPRPDPRRVLRDGLAGTGLALLSVPLDGPRGRGARTP